MAEEKDMGEIQRIWEKILRGEPLTEAEQTTWSNRNIAPDECPKKP